MMTPERRAIRRAMPRPPQFGGLTVEQCDVARDLHINFIQELVVCLFSVTGSTVPKVSGPNFREKCLKFSRHFKGRLEIGEMPFESSRPSQSLNLR
jgi:hypothetical protein